MKRTISLLLVATLLFTSCSAPNKSNDTVTSSGLTTLRAEIPAIEIPNYAFNNSVNEVIGMPDFNGVGDPALLRYIEDSVYDSIITKLDSDSFFVENISAIYASQEYLDELAFNSQENTYFGYTLSELDAQFQNTKYVFTLGDDGQTTVQQFVHYDDTFDKIVRNVAVGTGVVLVCVTVSVVTVGAAPAVSFIFAASAKTAAGFGVSGTVFSGAIAAVVTGVETNDVDATLKAAALAASDGFMWGAITGVFVGGGTAALSLRGATLNGLTMNQAAAIQRDTKFPLDVIKQFHTVEEANLLAGNGRQAIMLNGKSILIPGGIDLNLADDLGRTNLQRMGLAPIDGQLLQRPLNPIYRDPNGIIRTFEWHHVGQRTNGTLALLTVEEHDNPILHGFLSRSEIDREGFAQVTRVLNRALGELLHTGGGL